MVGSFGQGVGGERLNTLKGMIQNPDVQDKLGRLSRLAPSRQQDGHQQAWSHQGWAAMVSSGWALASCAAVATQSRHATRSYTTPVADGARSALRAVGPWRCGGSSWASPFSEHTNVVRLTSGSLDPAEVADLAILSSMFNDSPLMRRLRTDGIASVEGKAKREPALAGYP